MHSDVGAQSAFEAFLIRTVAFPRAGAVNINCICFFGFLVIGLSKTSLVKLSKIVIYEETSEKNSQPQYQTRRKSAGRLSARIFFRRSNRPAKLTHAKIRSVQNRQR